MPIVKWRVSKAENFFHFCCILGCNQGTAALAFVPIREGMLAVSAVHHGSNCNCMFMHQPVGASQTCLPNCWWLHVQVLAILIRLQWIERAFCYAAGPHFAGVPFSSELRRAAEHM